MTADGIVLTVQGSTLVAMVISDGKRHEVTVARQQRFAPGTILVFDRGYVDFAWFASLIPAEVGGLSKPPYSGMRTLFLWQDRRDDRIGLHMDCESTLVSYEPVSNRLVVQCRVVGFTPVDEAWYAVGTHIELSAGPRVLAVGIIVAPTEK